MQVLVIACVCFSCSVLEIFVFLKMNGDMERVRVLPMGFASEDEALERFHSFDSSAAQCYLPEDRERLLGVVESGFGDHASFNKVVRKLFIERSRKVRAPHRNDSLCSLPSMHVHASQIS